MTLITHALYLRQPCQMAKEIIAENIRMYAIAVYCYYNADLPHSPPRLCDPQAGWMSFSNRLTIQYQRDIINQLDAALETTSRT